MRKEQPSDSIRAATKGVKPASENARGASAELAKRFTLSDLLAQCDPGAPLSAAEREWIDEPTVGLETLHPDFGSMQKT